MSVCKYGNCFVHQHICLYIDIISETVLQQRRRQQMRGRATDTLGMTDNTHQIVSLEGN